MAINTSECPHGSKNRATVKYTAFFRNTNLGRLNCPTKSQLEEAFSVAGGVRPSSFLTNGTVVFESKSLAGARSVLDRAQAALKIDCGLKEPAYLRSMSYLEMLVREDPFGSIDRHQVHELCISFLDCPEGDPSRLPKVSRRKDVELIHVSRTAILSVSHRIGKTPGSPNSYLEGILGCPVTTRAWNTVCRIVRRHALNSLGEEGR